ncbi:MAG: ABC transporter ATP-binding protein [Cyanobacteria bacterium Co-bin8]|nr:ABC transporter ATP-binding protein [Cyanobacteria bacterium Co-bin8]
MSSQKLLLKFASRHPVLVVLSALLGFSGAIFNGVSTALVVPVIFGFLGQEGEFRGMPPIIQRILSLFDGIPEGQRFAAMLGVILLAIALKNLTAYMGSLTSNRLSQALTNSIRKDGIQLLLEVDIDFYSSHRIGDLINTLGTEAARTSEAIRTVIQFFITAITILVFVGLLLAISWQLTLVSTGLLFLVALANQYFVRLARQQGDALSAKSRGYSVALLEILSGIRLVKATGNESKEYAHLSRLIEEREQVDLSAQMTFAAIGPINEMAGILTVLAIVVLGRFLFINELTTLSTVLLTYLLVLSRLLPFVSQLNTLRSRFAGSTPSAQIVHDFLNRLDKPFMSNGTQLYTGLNHEVVFDQVSFQYPGQAEWVLKDVTLRLPKGTTLALVGASGAGKSTLADLLPRFYDCTEGQITLDGVDLQAYDVSSLRRAMGIVSQDTFLFNASVYDNITYGCHEVTQEAVVGAVKQANAYEFIMNLPQGFETAIGDRGVMLSGGQRQRLAIARALLRDPDILILDEATSALDTVSERLVQQAIDNISRDRTTLVIAHRLSTIQKADQIAVLDQGRVVEVGTHADLLDQAGYYARLYALQFSQNLELAQSGQETTSLPS